MELTKLSVTELKRLKSRIDAEIARRTDHTRRDLLKKIQKMTAEAGLSITDVLGEKSAAAAPKGKRAVAAKKATPKGSKGKVAPKYRDPANGAQTWTGRGRKPQWVASWLAEGKALDDLLIKN